MTNNSQTQQHKTTQNNTTQNNTGVFPSAGAAESDDITAAQQPGR